MVISGPEPFTVRVDDEVLIDLRARIGNTRWPGAAPGEPWAQGADLAYLRELLGYWADGFDWRAQERWLNGFRHFLADIDGVRVHFVHERARSGRNRACAAATSLSSSTAWAPPAGD